MHMVPVDAPCAVGEFTEANKIVPINMRIDAEASVTFFKNYTHIFGLLKKSSSFKVCGFRSSIGLQFSSPVCLRFAATC